MPHEDTIRKCSIFRELDDESVGLLAREAVTKKFAKGARIFSHGDEVPGLYIVASGLVRVYQVSAQGKTHVLHFAEPGKTFAEVAVMGGFRCPAHAEALEPSVCALIPAHRFQALLRSHHTLCLQLLAGMSRWVRQLVGLLEDVVLRDASGRVARYLLTAAPAGEETPFALPMLRKDLASHLNLTSETLSRTLRRLIDTGVIAGLPDQRIQIHDRDALEEIAEGLLPAEFDA